ncbi:MAG: peptidylprolyl isomerase [Maricaulis sp.]|jgi:peptidyl-prolyl cis-trans isomerase SurA|nr:peptidylprolyl isomerase [Maricaulis sp.]
MKNRARHILTSIAAAAMLALAPSAFAQQVEGIVVLVNDQPITTVDVRNRMRMIIASSGTQPSPEAIERIQEQAVRGLIDESLQLQAAAEFEVTVDPAEIDSAIDGIAERNGTTREQITSELAAAGVDIATLRRQLEAEIAWQILVSGRYGSRIRVSTQQIEAALERIAASASQPQYYIAEIFLELTSAGGEQQLQQQATAVLNALRENTPFQVVAQQFSAAPSATNGGEVGWVLGGQLRPEVQQVAQVLEPGQLSRPIRVPGGYMIIAMIQKREGTTTVQYDLTQVTVPTSAVTENTPDQLRRALDRATCANVDSAISGVPGAFATPLGEIPASSLLQNIRDALNGLEAGDATQVLETAAGRQAFLVCDRSIGGPGMPTRDDIEEQLRGQQLSNQSRRWLRDLRREATIEYR